MSDKTLFGRIAFRQEGEDWNAYYSLVGTMEGAVLLGSIKLALVQREDRKNAFMRLMENCVGDVLNPILGGRSSWDDPQPAPEHERAGNG